MRLSPSLAACSSLRALGLVAAPPAPPTPGREKLTLLGFPLLRPVPEHTLLGLDLCVGVDSPCIAQSLVELSRYLLFPVLGVLRGRQRVGR